MSSTVHSFCFLITLSSIVDEVEVVSTMADMAAASTMVDMAAASTMVDIAAGSTMLDMEALSTMVDMAALSTNLVVNEILPPGLSKYSQTPVFLGLIGFNCAKKFIDF